MRRVLLLAIPGLVLGQSFTPQEAIKWCAQWNLRTSSLQARITQTLTTPATTETYEGYYQSKVPARLRIDYEKPYKQTVVAREAEFYWYIPSQGKVWHDDGVARKVQADLRRLVARGPERPAVENADDFVYVFGKRSLRDQLQGIYVVDFAPKGRQDFSLGRIWIDPHQWLVKRVEIYDLDQKLQMVEERSHYVQVNGIWLPQRVNVRMWTPQGLQKIATTYRDLGVNQPIPDERFKFEIPANAQKVPLYR